MKTFAEASSDAVLYNGVRIMPAEVARDASEMFSSTLEEPITRLLGDGSAREF